MLLTPKNMRFVLLMLLSSHTYTPVCAERAPWKLGWHFFVLFCFVVLQGAGIDPLHWCLSDAGGDCDMQTMTECCNQSLSTTLNTAIRNPGNQTALNQWAFLSKLLWLTSITDRHLCVSIFRGHKRKLEEAREDNDDDDDGGSSKDSNEEGSNSEADEMAAALEAELNDFMWADWTSMHMNYSVLIRYKRWNMRLCRCYTAQVNVCLCVYAWVCARVWE